MRFLTFASILALTACSGAKDREQSLAQCQLQSSGPAAAAFRKRVAGGPYDPRGKGWDYAEFMLTCMKAKGFDFQSVIDRDGKFNHMCFMRSRERPGLSDPFIDEPSCYSGKWL